MSELSAMRVGVAGAGIIGLSCAYELLRRGHKVTLFDGRHANASTSWAAAGMLGPAYEMFLHEEEAESGLGDLCFESAGLWPGFARAVQEDSGLPVGYRRDPTLALARSGGETAALDALKSALAERGEVARWLILQTARERFGLSRDVRGVLEIESDHQVDNRKLLTALRSAVQQMGGQLIREDVVSLEDARQKSGTGNLTQLVWARGREETGVSACVKGQALSLERQPG
ncbi:MAG: FAD-dependent oxidoreductase, partial [Henriciella sp.]|uniref:FAD-dependent oxidoreductase n=1 Tax=Henriciella sp. TaxID=1968823 RepID=UPI003C72C059